MQSTTKFRSCSATTSSLFSSAKADTNKANIVNLSSVQNNVRLWHKRLGHPNNHVMQIVMTHVKFVYSPLELSSLIFGDLFTLPHVGYKYYVPFIDTYLRFTWIFPIKSKARTLIFFKPSNQWLS